MTTGLFKTLAAGLVGLLVLAFGCAPAEKVSRPTPETKPRTVQNFEKMQEDFDPVALNDDDIELEEDVDYSHVDETLLSPQRSVKDTVAAGYRVQIYQTTDREEAREVYKEAILRFEQDVYQVFDPPFYKVRVGDFVNWYDAEQVQQLAMKKGYRDAWIVRTKVNLKKAYDWMDEF